MAHEYKSSAPSPTELRVAFEARQKFLKGQPGVSELRTGDEIIYDDGMLDQCGIGYYPPVKNKDV